MRCWPRFSLLLSASCVVLSAHAVFADVPHLIRYQGQAVDANGVPLEGPYTLTFRFYDAETAGTKLWEEIQPTVPLSKGHFSVLLGSVTPLATMDWSQPRWLSVQVNTEPELTPRQRITSVPSALVAERLAVPVTTSTIADDANRLVPPGAILLLEAVTCPIGYTRVSTFDDKFLVGSSTSGVVGGSNTHDHGGQTGSHTLTPGELPSHSHALPTDACGVGDMQAVIDTGNADESYSASCATMSGATGGGGGHTHPIALLDNRPAFRTVLLCRKD